MIERRAALCVLFAALASACASDDDGAEVAPGPASTGSMPLPASLAGVPVPDTALARSSAELFLGAAPEFLVNHTLRTYVFGALLLEAQGRAFDAELAFVAVMLHDLGLVEPYISPDRRFELDSADAASRLLMEHRRSAEEAALVWEAIALHLTGEIAARMAPEIALVALGAAADATGAGLEQLPESEVAAVLEAYPRLGFKEAAVQGIIDQCERKPFAYALHPWVEVGRRYIEDFPVPDVEALIRAAPFAD